MEVEEIDTKGDKGDRGRVGAPIKARGCHMTFQLATRRVSHTGPFTRCGKSGGQLMLSSCSSGSSYCSNIGARNPLKTLGNSMRQDGRNQHT